MNGPGSQPIILVTQRETEPPMYHLIDDIETARALYAAATWNSYTAYLAVVVSGECGPSDRGKAQACLDALLERPVGPASAEDQRIVLGLPRGTV